MSASKLIRLGLIAYPNGEPSEEHGPNDGPGFGGESAIWAIDACPDLSAGCGADEYGCTASVNAYWTDNSGRYPDQAGSTFILLSLDYKL